MNRCDPGYEALDESIDRFTLWDSEMRPPAATCVAFLRKIAVNEIPDSALIKAQNVTA